MSTVETKRIRRPAARHRDVIIAAAEERLLMLEQSRNIEDIGAHAERMRELFSELKRSFSKEESE